VRSRKHLRGLLHFRGYVVQLSVAAVEIVVQLEKDGRDAWSIVARGRSKRLLDSGCPHSVVRKYILDSSGEALSVWTQFLGIFADFRNFLRRQQRFRR
jgi:hypothetical protein